MTRSILFIFMFLTLGFSLSAQTILRGKVLDDNGQPLDFANVSYESESGAFNGTSTDIDGTYSVQVDPGTYTVIFSSLGFQDRTFTGVVVLSGKATKLDGTLVEEGVLVAEATVTAYKIPIVDVDGGGTKAFTGEQMSKLPTRDALGAATTVPGVNKLDDGTDGINAKGARSNSTVFYLDGVRIRGPLPPATEIEQLEVMTGGIEAKYGDTGGGIISVISKGPSSKFSGNLEVESSQFLDPYGYNLGYLNLSGPILSKTMKNGRKKSILGFRLSGQYRLRKDDRPSIVPIYVASDEAKAKAEKIPTFVRDGSDIPVAEEFTTIGKEGQSGVDVWKLDYRPDEEEKAMAFTTKIDARLTDNFQMTLTGTYNNTEDKFTPGGWQFMNSHNNPTDNNSRLRGIFRIRHKLGNWSSSAEENQGLLRNFSYTILASYEKRAYDRKDPRFGDNLFEYGHAAVIKTDFVPTFTFSENYVEGSDSISLGSGIGYVFHNGYNSTFQSYEASTFNPGLSAYNPSGDVVTEESQLLRRNGRATNAVIDNIWNQLGSRYKNANQVYNTFRHGSQELASIQGNISFDLKSEDGGNHSINLGFQYEERSDVDYNLRPQALWAIAGLAANSALQGVDKDVNLGSTETTFNGQTINPTLYGALLEPDFADNKRFFQAIRELGDGVALTEYINVSAFSPADLSLDMFAGSEIVGHHNGGRTLDYYGFDYLGNPVGRTTSFNDFFTTTDKFGNKTYPVAPAQPIYLGGYIQDKFIYEDMIFKLGVRVDRYDANTKVMRDKYSLYEIQGAGSFHRIEGTNPKPQNIKDDYKVYVTSAGGKAVEAYRNGDQWYFPNGTEASGGNLIFGGGVVNPSYLDKEGNLIDKPTEIHDSNFDPERSFKDFEPQWDISPRLSFSFPISDKANFFAHYDVLAQRPTSNTVMTPLDYFNFFNDGGTRNNPDLKTQKAIDYAVGFQQKVSKSSAIKLTAFYQEMRDLIQSRVINYVPFAGRYTTYDNLDFSTTKGFTFQYDLRRTQNVSLFFTYSLQFVNGTGSSANSSSGIATRGNIRTTSPLNFDQRHTIQTILDYRYKKKEGPRLFGKYIFQNAGVNLLMNSYSGRPFTARAIPTLYDGEVIKGELNGSRMPWSYTMGVRVDKDFSLTKKGAKHPVFVNVYFRASNLLNTANIVNVYPATGSAHDDGYLTTQFGQGGLNSIRDSGGNIDSYLNFYNWGLENPRNFVLPRRLYMGIIFDF